MREKLASLIFLVIAHFCMGQGAVIRRVNRNTQVQTPTSSPGPKTYSSAQNVSLSDGTAGATICYRLDGTNPTAPTAGTCGPGSTAYVSAFNISTTTTVKALGTKAGMTNSAVMSDLYTINSLADCINTPPFTIGNGVVCTKAAANAGTTTNITANQLNFSPTAGHGVFVWGYFCSTPDCFGTDSGARMTIEDNVSGFGNPETCFSASRPNPFNDGTGNFYIYAWYCPSIPSGVTSITLRCTIANSCSYISVFPHDLTGACASAPCFDGDGIQLTQATTSGTASTSAGSFTNDIVISLAGNTGSTTETATNGCYRLNQQFAGNLVMAKPVSAPGVQTCGSSWTGPQDVSIEIVNLKTALSQ